MLCVHETSAILYSTKTNETSTLPLCVHVKPAAAAVESTAPDIAPPSPAAAACGVQPAVMTISVWLRLQEITGDLRPCTSTQPERNGWLLLISHSAILHTLLH